MPKRILQYSMRTFLLFVTLLAAYFPCARIYHTWFATSYDDYYVGAVLYSKLRNGDSVQDVSKHFDSMKLLAGSDKHDMENITDVWGVKKLTIEEGDQFFHVSTPGGAGAYLQFRDGTLVNLRKGEHSNPKQLAKLNNYSVPHQLLRFGVWPGYLVVVAFVLFANWLAFRHRRSGGRTRDAATGANAG